MLCHSVGGFSCWFSSFQPHLVQVHPHTVAKKIFQKWEHNRISPLLKPVHQPQGQSQACVLYAQGTTPAPSPPVLLGLSPLLPSLPPAPVSGPLHMLSSFLEYLSHTPHPTLRPGGKLLENNFKDQVEQRNVCISFLELLSQSTTVQTG